MAPEDQQAQPNSEPVASPPDQAPAVATQEVSEVQPSSTQEPVQNATTPVAQTEIPSASVPAQPAPIADSQLKTSTKPKWLLPVAVIAGLLVVGGGGAYGYMGVYMQRPENIWKQAVKNTGKGLVAYTDTVNPVQKGLKIIGNFKLTKPQVADGTIEATTDEKNANAKITVGASGTRVGLEMRAITPDSAKNPDIYLKAEGLKGIGSLLGSSDDSLDEFVETLENSWFVIDHTLLDQAAASAAEGASVSSITSEDTQKALQEAGKKMAKIMTESMFTTSDTKAVAVVKETLAKEDFKGRKSQHYKVQVRKQQLKDMVVGLKDAIKDTKLKDIVMSDQSSKTFEDAIGFDGILKSIESMKDEDSVVDVWVDLGLKYVRNVRFPLDDGTPAKKIVGAADVFLDYKGGDEFPLSLNISGKDDKGTTAMNLGLVLNKKTNGFKFTVGIDDDTSGSKTQGNLELNIEGTSDKVSAEKPAGAKNLLELLGGLLGGSQTTSDFTDLTQGLSDFSSL